MRKAFKADPDFKRGYIDNVSMHIYDRVDDAEIRYNNRMRNPLAEGILDLIFSK